MSYVIAVILFLTAGAASAQAPEPSAVSAWMTAPAAGATTADVYVELKNPTMYDIYVVSAAAPDTAASVELRAAGAAGAALPEMTVPAFGGTSAEVEAPHVRLVGLKRVLKAGDTIDLALKTDAAQTLTVRVDVRAP